MRTFLLRNHLTSIYHKLGLRNRLELYQYAIAKGLDDPLRYRAKVQNHVDSYRIAVVR